MGNLKAKELDKIGYADDKLKSLVINTIAKHYKHQDKTATIALLTAVKQNPAAYVSNNHLQKIAEAFIKSEAVDDVIPFKLMETPAPLKIYGSDEIEEIAKRQMALALLLPISMQGALMPDAHSGYGLPIGGVLATRNAVIPYGVGMDIGCRMALSIIDADEKFMKRYEHQVKQAMGKWTHFGMEGSFPVPQYHEVLDSPAFTETPLLKKLHGKAVQQLGTSGSGNHFVEFGLIELSDNNSLALAPKTYMVLLTHSGSRGLGANIARHYTQIAMDTCKLSREAQPLAWLDLASEAGQEYWMSMTLAGDYASACHDWIHINLLKALGLKVLHKVQNHHNFAWKEVLADGSQAIVHRKGATPAHKGELGIIPGSMATPAYLVIGKGNTGGLNSASHGAGRAMSRQDAKASTTKAAMKKMLAQNNVTLLDGSIEENPLAYKDIETVMAAQTELVTIQGKFCPRIVRMNKE
ncbi:RtcB family protein [Mucilaginibacter sp. FT3.2]|uniref:RtcB family protein n=1 Tax=Mucilaginibacter sp. FT3.2 TaxID=2723090 RepID=UPI001611336A|nr:RtcB family protein [Mucilaginibacter sp. FT3.2]MBB6232630.1 tRNA-splicing ligase RtcB [Mucilaginibacter sp. FT3.2]